MTEIRFYWVVLDAPGVRAGPVPPGLLPALEDDVPIPADQLWAVGAPGDDGRYTICAARRADLRSLPATMTSLIPDRVPEFVSADPSRFNLLIGEFEPLAIRRSRRRAHFLAAATVLLSAALIGVGLTRRAEAWNAEAKSRHAAARDVVASVAPSAHWTADDLAMELMQKRQVNPEELRLPGDAALTLSTAIARWPTEIQAKAQSVMAGGDAASLSVTVPGDPARFLSVFKAPEGWRLEEPRLTAIDKATRLTLELRRSTP